MGGFEDVAKIIDEGETFENPNPSGAIIEGGRYIDPNGNVKIWEANKLGLPPLCPVEPLGKKNDTFYFLDQLSQIVEYDASKLGNSTIKSLFGTKVDLLAYYWPSIKERKFKTTKEVDGKKETIVVTEYFSEGWKTQDTQTCLMRACAERGVWDASERIRQRGAWRSKDGSLVYHCGNKIWTKDGIKKTGLINEFVYPTDPKLPAPFKNPIAEYDEDIEGFVELLNSWNWARPALDPMLLFGWIGCSVIGGALDWRPMAYLTGDRASGKSTLQEVIKKLFGDGLLQTADTSAAGIYQEIDHSSVPIAIDEFENDKASQKAQAVIKLARLSSSGGKMLRGGADHKGRGFTCRSCFLMSSIIMPPLGAQDLSRMAILQLDELPQGQAQPDLSADKMANIGAKIKRRMIDGWEDYLTCLIYFHEMLKEQGHSNRAADQFGTLLAARHVLIFDGLPTDDLRETYLGLMEPHKIMEISNNNTDADGCLSYLLEFEVGQLRKGRQRQVAQLIEHYISPPIDDQQEAVQVTRYLSPAIRDDMASAGLAITRVKQKDGGFTHYMAVSNSHKKTIELFKESHWAGEANSMSGWSQALSRIPNALKNRTVKIAGKSTRAVCVPLHYILCRDEASLDDTDREANNQLLVALNEGFGDVLDEASIERHDENRDETNV